MLRSFNRCNRVCYKFFRKPFQVVRVACVFLLWLLSLFLLAFRFCRRCCCLDKISPSLACTFSVLNFNIIKWRVKNYPCAHQICHYKCARYFIVAECNLHSLRESCNDMQFRFLYVRTEIIDFYHIVEHIKYQSVPWNTVFTQSEREK